MNPIEEPNYVGWDAVVVLVAWSLGVLAWAGIEAAAWWKRRRDV